MQPLSRQDLVKPHIDELRQQAQQARIAQAASQARQQQARQRRHKARNLRAPALARRILAALALRSP